MTHVLGLCGEPESMDVDSEVLAQVEPKAQQDAIEDGLPRLDWLTTADFRRFTHGIRHAA